MGNHEVELRDGEFVELTGIYGGFVHFKPRVWFAV
jgi:hypothetical protein